MDAPRSLEDESDTEIQLTTVVYRVDVSLTSSPSTMQRPNADVSRTRTTMGHLSGTASTTAGMNRSRSALRMLYGGAGVQPGC